MKGYRDDYDTPVPKGTRVAVIGGGNVAMDAARCAMRMGAEKVYIIYRRSMDEIPARREEIHHAIQEGVDFQLLRNPVQIVGDDEGHVTGVEVIKMQLGEADASGRRKPVAIEGSNYILDVDEVIMAIGTRLNTLILDTTKDLEANKANLDKQISSYKDELKELEKQEKEITPGLDTEIVYKFQRIIQRNREGIVAVRNGVCSGCNMILPAQFANIVREGENINFCPYCSRILFYEDTGNEKDFDPIISMDDAGSLADLDDDFDDEEAYDEEEREEKLYDEGDEELENEDEDLDEDASDSEEDDDERQEEEEE